MDITASDLQLDFLGFSATGSGGVNVDVIEEDGKRNGNASIQFDQFSLARKGRGKPLIVGEGLKLIASAADLGVV